jgi:hypothetical protein
MTTREAVDTFVRLRQPRSGELVTIAGGHDRPASLDRSDSEVARAVIVLAEQVERLAREVGRLEAELAQERRAASISMSGVRRAQGPGAGVWGRVGRWLLS